MNDYIDWAEDLDERQRKEIKLAMIYAEKFAHGTDGHHRLLLIAMLAKKLDLATGASKVLAE